MKKKQIGIVIMAVLFVALLAVYFMIMQSSPEQEPEDTGAESAGYDINTVSAESVNGFSYTKDGEEYSFTLDGDGWKYDADDKFPVDGVALGKIVEATASVKASKVIEGVDVNGAEYGMDAPTHILKLKLKSGAEHIYNVGSYNKHSGLYYFSYPESDKLYMVSSSFVSLFGGELEDLLLLDKMDSINTDNVTSIKAAGPLGEFTLEISEGEDGEKVYTHTNEEGGVQELEAEAAEKMLSSLCSVKLTKCADYYAEDGELSSYGLDEDDRTKITIAYTTKITSENESTGTSSTANIKKECVYYLGRVIEDKPPSDEDNGADTTASDLTEGGEVDGSDTEKTEKIYLLLEKSTMIFDVSIDISAVFLEKTVD